ncbi:MAG: 50S ribosomal protein L12 [Candidatus Micrarchaeia archaeon]
MTKVDPYLHAVLLLHGAGKEVNEGNLSSVLKSAGVEADGAKVKVLADAVKGVNFEDLLKNALVVAAPAAAAPAAEAKKEAPKEDPAKKEEQAAEGLANLFG